MRRKEIRKRIFNRKDLQGFFIEHELFRIQHKLLAAACIKMLIEIARVINVR